MQVKTVASPRRFQRPAWLVSFADLIALLLAFFVLLYAMQRVEHGSWEALIQSLSHALQPSLMIEDPEPSADRNVESLIQRPAINLSYLEVLLRGRRSKDAAFSGMMLRRRDDQLIIMVPSDLLFEPSEATLAAAARDRLSALALVLRNISNRVDIYGHTDPTPVRNGRFRSNWELSIARAVAVADQLRKFGYRRPMSTFGFADTRFDDVASIETQARRFEYSRRVDIVVRASGDIRK